MESTKIFDQAAYPNAMQKFKQETVDPAVLTLIPLPPLEILSQVLPTALDELPLKKARSHCTATKIYDFPLGGKTYAMHFSWSAKKRQQNQNDLTNWFNKALDLISKPEDHISRLALIISFSLRTGKLRYQKTYNPKPKCTTDKYAVQQEARIPGKLKKKITKEEAQQWLYFKNQPQKLRKQNVLPSK